MVNLTVVKAVVNCLQFSTVFSIGGFSTPHERAVFVPLWGVLRQNALPVSAVKDAITPIITACGYSGTDSKWQFPAMSIPAIPGLFDEIPLTDAQDIDLTAYATLYIPETLLMLVRSLLTAGLIMFAIKELMNLAGSIFGDEHKGGAS